METPQLQCSSTIPNESNESKNGDEGLAQCYGEPISDLDKPFWSLFADTAKAHAEQIAIVSLWQSDVSADKDVAETQDLAAPHRGSLRWTYAELCQRSEAVAQWLKGQGCRSGTNLVTVLWNSAEWALFFWAAAKLGMVFVPLDPRIVASDARHFLNLARPSVLVVQDAEAEENIRGSIPDILEESTTVIRISCSDIQAAGWVALQTIPRRCNTFHESGAATEKNVQQEEIKTGDTDNIDELKVQTKAIPSGGDQPALIIFTSGTTSTPKACVHTTANVWAQTYDWDPNPPDQIDNWLVHTPVSHIFAVNNSLRAWRRGDAVVFASKSFNVSDSLQALVDEKCTHMSAVPALAKAILAHPAYPGKDALSLRYVTLGSTLISQADIELCRGDLGSVDAVQAYGMSEGAPLVSWVRKDPLLAETGFHPGVGKALPGTNMRICEPGSRRILRRNESGELHVGGPCVISRYLDGVDEESFYTDEISNWLVTGDQGLIDEHGVLHLLGRLKDLIIRSGENIAPMKIEAVLNELPGVAAQVVGVPDDMAGQLPVAIISKLPEGLTKSDIHQKVNTALGPQYALAEVYTFEELGLRTFPLTVTGKIRKDELRKIVLGQRARVAESATSSSEKIPHEDRVTQDLLSVWEDLLGFRPPPNTPIKGFADSITLLRYCQRFLYTFGQRLTLQDFVENQTVEGLAKLVVARAKRPSTTASNQLQPVPLSTNSLNSEKARSLDLSSLGFTSTSTKTRHTSHTSHKKNLWVRRQIQPNILETAPNRISSSQSDEQDTSKMPPVILSPQEALNKLGLTPDDLEQELSIKDYYCQLARGNRAQSYRHRVVFELQPHACNPDRVREALQRALECHPMLRTILVERPDESLAHLVLKPIAQVFQHLIQEVDMAHDEGAAALGAADDAIYFDTTLMAQVVVITVPATGKMFLSMTYSHTVFDMLSINTFHADLDFLLSAQDDERRVVPQLISYANFLEVYENYKTSVPAEEGVDFHVGRLRGISRFPAAFWPPARVRGWMIGTDSDSPAVPARLVARSEVWGDRIADLPHLGPTPRVSIFVDLPDLPLLLQQQPLLDPQTTVKTALAVFNIIKTGQPYAIFNTVEAGRSWPFLLDWVSQGLPAAMLIDGPTVDWVLRMVQVDVSSAASETVAGLLARMTQEQQDVKKHAHAPWFQVLEDLGPGDAEAALDASCRQMFVWDMSLRLLQQPGAGDYRALMIQNRFDWPDCGISWNCSMLDETRLMMVAAWDTAHMNQEEMQHNIGLLSDIVVRVATMGNWNRTLRDVFHDLV